MNLSSFILWIYSYTWDVTKSDIQILKTIHKNYLRKNNDHENKIISLITVINNWLWNGHVSHEKVKED